MAKKRTRRPLRESGYGRLGLKPPKFIPIAGSGGGGAGVPPGFGTALANANASAVPNIDQILANNPYYQGIKANLGAESIADAASRDAAMRRAAINFGYLPNMGGMDEGTRKALEGILDPTTKGLIEANTKSGMSVWARLLDAAQQTQKRVLDSVGARGLFNSGETGYGLKRAALQSDQARYDSISQLMDYLSGVQSAFVLSERQRLANEQAARDKAIDEAPPEAGYIPTYGGVANYNPIANWNPAQDPINIPWNPPIPAPPPYKPPRKPPKRGPGGGLQEMM